MSTKKDRSNEKDKDEPSSPKPVKQIISFEYERVRQQHYEAIGRPVEHRPAEGDLIELDLLNDLNINLASRGGKTICTIKERNFTGIGVAVCSYSDVFNRGMGKQIAYERAALALDYCKEVPGGLTPVITFGPRKG